MLGTLQAPTSIVDIHAITAIIYVFPTDRSGVWSDKRAHACMRGGARGGGAADHWLGGWIVYVTAMCVEGGRTP